MPNSDWMDQGNWQRAPSTVKTKMGMAGQSPPKIGPPTKVPAVFLEVLSAHVEVAQVSDGELKGTDIKRLINASTIGSVYDGSFNTNYVWRKLRKDYPQSLQAGKKTSVEDARAQWTTHENLSQWFDDVKRDLLLSGLVIDEPTYDKDGGLLSELKFSFTRCFATHNQHGRNTP